MVVKTYRIVVEILAFDVYKSQLLWCEARTIDRPWFITFLSRRNFETAEKTDYCMSCYGSIGKFGVYMFRRYISPLEYNVEVTSTMK